MSDRADERALLAALEGGDDAAGSVGLRIRDLNVTFGGLSALSDVHLELEPGDVGALIGPNGAGKSTLFNAINRLVQVGPGTRIVVGDTDLTRLRPDQIAAAGVGRSFQNPVMSEGRSVLENMLVGAHLRARYRMVSQMLRIRRVAAVERDLRGEALELLGLMGLAAVADVSVGGISYGRRKLVDIGRALMSKPSVLLLDEPTSGLDRNEQQLVADIIETIRDTTSMTVLVVEHHMNVVRRVAQHAVALEAGSVIAAGPVDEVLDSTAYREAVVGTHGAASAHLQEPGR